MIDDDDGELELMKMTAGKLFLQSTCAPHRTMQNCFCVSLELMVHNCTAFYFYKSISKTLILRIYFLMF